MRWTDGLAGILLMAAAMTAVVAFGLPFVEGSRTFIFFTLVCPLAALGGAIAFFGRKG